MKFRLWVFFVPLALTACGSRTGLLFPFDGAVGIDAARVDGAPLPIDLGFADLSRPDLALPDFGVIDGGPPVIDFGLPDFGTDFGLPDLDLGVIDAGPPASLRGLRAELPCMGPLMGGLCPAPATATDMATLMGPAGTTYDVALQIRGVTEGRRYTCTSMMGSWCESSETPSRSDNYNVWGLSISGPAQQFYLNLGMEAPESFVLDDVHVVRMTAGSTLALTGDSINSAEFPNRDVSGMPVVVPGVPPDPMAFDGEFVQIDVLSISPVP